MILYLLYPFMNKNIRFTIILNKEKNVMNEIRRDYCINCRKETTWETSCSEACFCSWEESSLRRVRIVVRRKSRSIWVISDEVPGCRCRLWSLNPRVQGGNLTANLRLPGRAGHAHWLASDFLAKKLSAQGHKPTDEHPRKYFSFSYNHLPTTYSVLSVLPE